MEVMVLNSKLNPEDFILLLLNANDREKIKGKLCFQKEVFLIVKEICPNLDHDLNFEAYHYGPYSKNLVNLLDYLENDSLISIEKNKNSCSYSITMEGVERLSQVDVSEDILRKISNLKRRSHQLGYEGLLRYVYFNYPDYTEKSMIVDKILGDN